MASYFEISEYDSDYSKVIAPIMVNDIPYITLEDKENFNKIILTTYDTDVLSPVPSCGCGRLQNGFNLKKICNYCGTEVTYPAAGDVGLKTWFRIPNGFHGFIIPSVYIQLTNILNPKGYNLLEWLISTRSRPPRNISKDTAKRIEYFEFLNWPRGLNGFIENFDKFLEIIAEHPLFSKTKATEYAVFLRAHKSKLFPKHIPMPTKAMLIYEKTYAGGWADNDSITGAIDAARNMVLIESPRYRPLSHKQIENKIVNAILHLVDYYSVTIKKSFCGKNGWLRGQLFRSRSHFCARGVITSINGPHSYEEIHIPWAQGLELFKIHLVSKMFKLGYSEMEAYSLIESSGNVYVKLLDDLLKELIAEGPKIERILDDVDVVLPKSGCAVFLQRNPSLHRLSAQYFYITKVKTDLTDKTISLSVLVIKGSNADFDGDEMNLILLIGKEYQEAGAYLRSYFGIHDNNDLGKISNVCGLPDVTVATMSNALSYVN